MWYPIGKKGELVEESITLVRKVKNTIEFTLENGETVEAKGDEEIEYDGEMHTAANLFDALKEGYYGKF